VSGDVLARIVALERRVGVLERGAQPGAPPKAAAAPRAPRRSNNGGAPSAAPIRRLAIGEELRGRFQKEITVAGNYGDHLALIVADEGGALVTLSAAHKALHNLVRKEKLGEGDRIAVKRLEDGTTEGGKSVRAVRDARRARGARGPL